MIYFPDAAKNVAISFPVQNIIIVVPLHNPLASILENFVGPELMFVSNRGCSIVICCNKVVSITFPMFRSRSNRHGEEVRLEIFNISRINRNCVRRLKGKKKFHRN